MCGIWAILGAEYSVTEHASEFMKIAGRGPDFTIMASQRQATAEGHPPLWLGFHRLAIVEPGDQPSSQPVVFRRRLGHGHATAGQLSAVCNGEIYNHLQLKSASPVDAAREMENGGSDCAAIIHSFLTHSGDLKACCASLDGVFAFLMSDGRRLYVGRDPIGVRPLFYGLTLNGAMVFGSEMKAIEKLCVRVDYFPPGCCAQIALDDQPSSTTFFSFRMRIEQYFRIPTTIDWTVTMFAAREHIRHMLVDAVEKRLMGNRLFGFMLSGGLDSSLIASIASKFLRAGTNGISTLFPMPIAFSVGFEDSPDLEQARRVAHYLGIPHRVLVIHPEECVDIVPEVVHAMETFDPLLIRCGIPHYLLCRHIAATSEVKVLLSGEGADELFGSYDYMQNAPSAAHLHGEILRRLRRLHQYDVLRCDRATSCHGLEIRVPFLDKRLVEFVARLPPSFKLAEGLQEKHVLRSAFEGWLPNEVLWRRKEGFSEALGRQDLGQLLRQHAETVISDREFTARYRLYPWRTPDTKEEFWYRSLFERMFERKRVDAVIHTKVYWTASWHRSNRLLVSSDSSSTEDGIDYSEESDEEGKENRSSTPISSSASIPLPVLMVDVGVGNGGGVFGMAEEGNFINGGGSGAEANFLLEPMVDFRERRKQTAEASAIKILSSSAA